jgi:hypothetical protein
MHGGRSAQFVGLKPGWRDLRFILLESPRSHVVVLPPLRHPSLIGLVEGFDMGGNHKTGWAGLIKTNKIRSLMFTTNPSGKQGLLVVVHLNAS